MPTKEVLQVRITKATELVWEGDAQSISSKNVDGPFDVLPYHANFVTIIRGEPINLTLNDGQLKKFNFKYSVMYVQENQVKIYADFM